MLLERLRTGIGRGNEPKPVTIKDLQRDLPVYGPAVPLTLEEVARRARQDPMPLRGPEGGYYGADRHPGILARQLREFEEAFGTTDDRELPRWLVWTGLAVMVLVLGGLGYFLAPVVLGLQGDVVAGAGGAAGDYGKTLGLVVGMLAGMGMAYWLVRSMGLNATNTKSAWETVYAAARITQVEYLDLMDRPVPEGNPGRAAAAHPPDADLDQAGRFFGPAGGLCLRIGAGRETAKKGRQGTACRNAFAPARSAWRPPWTSEESGSPTTSTKADRSPAGGGASTVSGGLSRSRAPWRPASWRSGTRPARTCGRRPAGSSSVPTAGGSWWSASSPGC